MQLWTCLKWSNTPAEKQNLCWFHPWSRSDAKSKFWLLWPYCPRIAASAVMWLTLGLLCDFSYLLFWNMILRWCRNKLWADNHFHKFHIQATLPASENCVTTHCWHTSGRLEMHCFIPRTRGALNAFVRAFSVKVLWFLSCLGLLQSSSLLSMRK